MAPAKSGVSLEVPPYLFWHNQVRPVSHPDLHRIYVIQLSREDDFSNEDYPVIDTSEQSPCSYKIQGADVVNTTDFRVMITTTHPHCSSP